MDNMLNEVREPTKKNFFNHMFSFSDEIKAEYLNTIQYFSIGVIPVVILNKFIQRIIPEADGEKGSVEILLEIFAQLVIMFCGIIFIHRIITYFPTYSEYKYDHLNITNVILAFLILILSIQTKIGIKVSILVDRFVELWEGVSYEDKKINRKINGGNSSGSAKHSPSRSDNLDNNNLFPPSAVSSSNQQAPEMISGMGGIVGGGSSSGRHSQQEMYVAPEIMAANSLLGSTFGSSF